MKKDKTQSTTTKVMQLSNDIYLIIDLITYIVIIKCQLILSLGWIVKQTESESRK